MQRDFCLGSQWLYYKVYTGIKTADQILVEKLGPAISYLEETKKIQKWFFIRYRDPDTHIRLRFFVDDIANLSIIINTFYSIFNEFMDEDVIWKIQTDTYQREIERYGKKTMYSSEFLFWKDSTMVLKYLSIINCFAEKETPLFFSFVAIDSFLNSFNLSNLEKVSLMNELQIAFKKEFDIGKIQKKKIDVNYRSLSSKFEFFLGNSIQGVYSDLFSIVNERSYQIKDTALEIINNIEIPLNDFLLSHIHMMINRQYTSKQRTYELVIYDHLYRYYKTLCHNR